MKDKSSFTLVVKLDLRNKNMKEKALKYLSCPGCNSDLDLIKDKICKLTGHILEGELNCTLCKSKYKIIKGVPFFNLEITDPKVSKNIKNFGDEWNYFTSKLDVRSAKGELDSYFHTYVEYNDLENKLILDAGCGGGRFTYVLAKETNAKEIIGVDLSNSVFTAFENTKEFDNVTIIQADIMNMPFKKRKLFDFILSVGVIHHMPAPHAGFDCLAKHLKDNGNILAWVYGKEGNFLYITFADPFRVLITSRLPFVWALSLALVLSLAAWMVIWVVYFPVNLVFGEKITNKILPLNEYLNFFRKRGFKDFWRTVFDKMIPTIANYISENEFRKWFESNNINYNIYFRNGHSWLGIGNNLQQITTNIKSDNILTKTK